VLDVYEIETLVDVFFMMRFKCFIYEYSNCNMKKLVYQIFNFYQSETFSLVLKLSVKRDSIGNY
jgi:hypothetical protein